MAGKVFSQPKSDPALQSLVESCNQLHALSQEACSASPLSPSPFFARPVSTRPLGASLLEAEQQRNWTTQSGPWRWCESCSHAIAFPRDVLTFRIELQSHAKPQLRDTYKARVHCPLVPELIYDGIQTITLDDKPIRPTNHSLSRTLDLQFNHITSGSHLTIVYQVRVHFNAEPMQVVLGGTRLRWSRVNREFTPAAAEPEILAAESRIKVIAETEHTLLAGMHIGNRSKASAPVASLSNQ